MGDGAGTLFPARLGPAGSIEATGEPWFVERPSPALTVAFAVTKGERPEWAVQKLTEVGVDRVVLFHADRSVARWTGDRAAGHVERLRRVAREASSQSQRAWLPEVEGVYAFADVVRWPGAALAQMGGEPPSAADTVLLVGPEGGWSEGELAAAGAAGCTRRIGLGPHVLRAETAAVVAGAVLSLLRAALLAPAGHSSQLNEGRES